MIRERVVTFTDRTLYTVQECIRFRADCLPEGIPEGNRWSDVLYVELVAPDGRPVSQGKYPVRDGRSSGMLAIPSTALTGNYFLKCYTRWMRNRGSANYCYIPLKIVNPFREEMTVPPNGDQGGGVKAHPYMSGDLACTTARKIYEPGEKVRVSLSALSAGRHPAVNWCMTVVPAGALDTCSGPVIPASEDPPAGPFTVRYLPDRDGLSVSGSVIGSGGEPRSYAGVHLALLGGRPDYLPAVADEYGRFVIPVPERTGMLEMFVAPDPGEDPAEIRVDQDFDTEMIPLSAGTFRLTGREREIATQMAVRMQLSGIYHPSPDSGAGENIRDTLSPGLPFYGTPVRRIEIDDYVNLPNLEEVFINLVPEVYVIRRKGVPELRIESDNSGIGIYRPLITIDHIPVFDQQEVLGIVSEKIGRIDVINEVYLKGNLSFGGVIAITSVAGDMAGIDLAGGSYFFDFKSFYPDPPAPSRGPPVPSPGEMDRIPDTRNTFLWLDHLEIEQNTTREISFRAPSDPGEYQVVVRGTAPGGAMLLQAASFTVD